jgi:hypothetical protein
VSLFASTSLGLGMALATGCSHTPVASAPQPDPLIGVPQPTLGTRADAGTVAPAPLASNTGGVPALPVSFSSSNPALLASTSGQRPLAMDDNHGLPPFLPTNVNRTAQTPGPTTAPTVERVPDATPPIQPTGSAQTNLPVVQPVSASQPTGDAAWNKQLEDRGVINQKQEPVAGGIRLTCYVSRGVGQPLRIVEIPVASDYAAAAQAVLKELATHP